MKSHFVEMPLQISSSSLLLLLLLFLLLHISNFFLGQHAPVPPLEAHACGDHGHGSAGPKTASLVEISETGI